MNTKNKNKIDLPINWPSGYFTMDDLFALNPDFKEITLRVRVDKARVNKLVSVIGYKNFKRGRPKMVLSLTPVQKETIDKAIADGIQCDNALVSILSVSNTPIKNGVSIPTLPTVVA